MKIGSPLAGRGRSSELVLLEQAGSSPWPVPDAQKKKKKKKKKKRETLEREKEE